MPSTLLCSTEKVTSSRALNGARSSTGWLVSRRHWSGGEHGVFQALQVAELVFFGNVVDFDNGHGELVQYKKASLVAFDQKLEVG